MGTNIKLILMIFLIVTFPICISNALAIVTPDTYPGTIKEVRIYGEQNEMKVLRPDSKLFVEVVVATANASPQDLTFTAGQKFQSCAQHPEGNICSLTITPPTAQSPGLKEYSVTYQPPGGSPYSISGNYVVDGTPPQVQTFSVSPSLVGGDEIKISYIAVDLAAGTDACAGVAGFQIAEDAAFQNIIQDVPIQVDSIRDCLESGTLYLDTPSISGDYSWFARAYDRVGNVAFSARQVKFTADVDAPIIDNPRFLLHGQELEFFPAGTNTYEVVVDVYESNNIETVDLNLAGSATCLQFADAAYECSWTVPFTFTDSSSSISGSITATDSLGNSRTHPLSIAANIDANAPSIGYFGTNFGTNVRFKNNTFYARIQETESGFSEDTVAADMHLINPILGVEKHPDECFEDVCYWYNIDAMSTEGRRTATVHVTDFAGNTNSLSDDFTIDKTAPVITNVVQSIDYATAQDPLYFIINATDSNGLLNASVDIGRASDFDGLFPGICELVQGDEYECVVEITSLKTHAVDTSAKIVVYDVAGNKDVEEVDFKLYEADLNAIPNEVDVEVIGITPQKIDRKIGTRMPIKLFVNLDYDANANIDVIYQRAYCPELSEVGILFTEPYWFGKEYYVVPILLDEVTASLDEVPINCELELIIKKNNVIFYNPELETINTSIELYNVPIGSFDSAVIDKLEDIKDRVEDWGDFFKVADDIFQWLKGFCDAFGAFKQVYEFLQALKAPLFLILQALHKYPPAASAADSAWKGYLKIVCYFRVMKNYAWPNNDPAKLGAGNQEKGITGGFSDDTKGWVRRVCAFVKCRQCNTDWSFVNRWANLNFEEPDDDMTFGEALESGESTTLNDKTGESVFKNVDLSVKVDPFDSWAVALACGCIPGIIHNAEKYRQLECMHAACILRTASAGFSTDACDELDDLRKCVFWLGGLLQLIPGYLFAQMIANKISEVLANLPARLLLASKNYLCNSFNEQMKQAEIKVDSTKECKQDLPTGLLDSRNPGHITCALVDTAMLVWSWDDMVDNAFNFTKYEFWEEGTDWCEEVDWDAIDDMADADDIYGILEE